MKGLFVGVLAVALTLGLSFGVMAEEGVTDTEIHIGQWGPQTGPAAPWGSVARGTDAYFKMINAEGGIHGRKLIHHMFDDGYNPAKTKAGVKELQEGTGMFAWVSGVGTSPGLSVVDYLMERKIPWVGPSAGSLHWIEPPRKYLFAVYPLYFIEAKGLCEYAVKTLGKKRIAIAYQNDDYGKNGVQGAVEQLEKYGMKLVAQIPVENTDTDMKPHIMQFKKAGADVVLLWVTPTHAVRLVGTAKAMQFAPQWMSTSTCSDFPFMFKISKGLWKDVIAATFGELPDSQDPLLLKYKKDAYEKYAAKDERWGIFYYAGILFAEPLVEGIKRCGKDLTRERLVKAMEGIKDFKGIGGKISYGPLDLAEPYACRQGQKEIFIVKCLDDGKYERLTGWWKIK
ncbi:MAG TPA: ABC transporter substrate-binding protein [Deltaproteobacteria bacterium]|nr:ABC transporter substrate-binding protein [Deltaproteobacteria bacterium]HIJ35778.1 ABC transporter substrate-binding protein [Deltaproteobacteria bacterium]HIJ40807.1 ABC transporter substrate-binding protein [Deltaproteobacteria bacterium]